jgi:hypothetical protein
MNEDLEEQGLITPLPIDPVRVRQTLDMARRDLEVSRGLLVSSSDWAYNVAYNAVLQAGRALIFSRGYRPDGPNQHLSVVRFAERYLETDDAGCIRGI